MERPKLVGGGGEGGAVIGELREDLIFKMESDGWVPAFFFFFLIGYGNI